MEGLVETFHLDIKLLVAQSINFLVVLAVLYFFALKPLSFANDGNPSREEYFTP